MEPPTGPVAPSVIATPQAAEPVLISEREVIFKTAAALAAPPAMTHRHWPGAAFIASVRHIPVRLPEPHTVYPRRENSYIDAARMSRMMEHL